MRKEKKYIHKIYLHTKNGKKRKTRQNSRTNSTMRGSIKISDKKEKRQTRKKVDICELKKEKKKKDKRYQQKKKIEKVKVKKRRNL